MAETFKVGDTVTTNRPTMPKGTVVFGPYRSAANADEWVLVQAEDGRAVSVPLSSLSHAPAFTVGQTVTERAMGHTVEVVAGPFKCADSSDRYVIKRRNGVHSWVPAQRLEKLPAEPLADWERDLLAGNPGSFVYDGRRYRLDAEYADHQGDVWRFNGDKAYDGMPLMDAIHLRTFRNWRLSDVLSNYGPLSRA